MKELLTPSPPISGPDGAPSGYESAAAAGFTIAFCLEGQLRLDDQPALHDAVALARRHPGSRLIVLATRPEDQRLRGPHQRRIEAQALASLRSRLAAHGIPLLAFPQQTTTTALAAAADADAVVLLTEWNEFRALSPEKLRAVMRGDVLLDLRNVYDPAAMRAAGFTYSSIGRP
jgi:hypothetical protein